MKKIIVFLLFALAGLLAGSALHIWTQWQKPSLNAASVLVDIPKGSSPASVGRILQDSGIITNGKHFQWYIRIMRHGAALKAGYFQIPSGVTIAQIADLITGGKEAAVWVTIPEGHASWEIFSMIKEHYPKLDSAKWDSLVHDSGFAAGLEVHSNSLEGWLFPSTYPFPIVANERQILTQMVRAAHHCVEGLDNGPTSEFNTLGGWQQTLTLASIVEKETGKDTERPHVAGVFHNRLRQHIPLGADPTVRFIFRNMTGPIYLSQLNSDSPYNTRKFAGLPPGPIANPGRKAIDAALHPLKTNDLYFVAKDDGSGEHFFAQNLKQHNDFRDKAARNRGEKN